MDLSCPDHLFPNTQQLFPGISERSYTQNYFSVLYVCDKHQCNTITHNFPPSSLVFLTYIDPVVVKNKEKNSKQNRSFSILFCFTSLLWASQGLHQLHILQRQPVCCDPHVTVNISHLFLVV